MHYSRRVARTATFLLSISALSHTLCPPDTKTCGRATVESMYAAFLPDDRPLSWVDRHAYIGDISDFVRVDETSNTSLYQQSFTVRVTANNTLYISSARNSLAVVNATAADRARPLAAMVVYPWRLRSAALQLTNEGNLSQFVRAIDFGRNRTQDQIDRTLYPLTNMAGTIVEFEIRMHTFDQLAHEYPGPRIQVLSAVDQNEFVVNALALTMTGNTDLNASTRYTSSYNRNEYATMSLHRVTPTTAATECYNATAPETAANCITRLQEREYMVFPNTTYSQTPAWITMRFGVAWDETNPSSASASFYVRGVYDISTGISGVRFEPTAWWQQSNLVMGRVQNFATSYLQKRRSGFGFAAGPQDFEIRNFRVYPYSVDMFDKLTPSVAQIDAEHIANALSLAAALLPPPPPTTASPSVSPPTPMPSSTTTTTTMPVPTMVTNASNITTTIDTMVVVMNTTISDPSLPFEQQHADSEHADEFVVAAVAVVITAAFACTVFVVVERRRLERNRRRVAHTILRANPKQVSAYTPDVVQRQQQNTSTTTAASASTTDVRRRRPFPSPRRPRQHDIGAGSGAGSNDDDYYDDEHNENISRSISDDAGLGITHYDVLPHNVPPLALAADHYNDAPPGGQLNQVPQASSAYSNITGAGSDPPHQRLPYEPITWPMGQ